MNEQPGHFESTITSRPLASRLTAVSTKRLLIAAGIVAAASTALWMMFLRPDGGRITVEPLLGLAAAICFLSGRALAQTAGGELLWRLLTATDAVSTNLSRIETALTDASLALSETGIDGARAVAVLSNLTGADSSVIDCITIDVNGTVHEVAPESFET